MRDNDESWRETSPLRRRWGMMPRATRRWISSEFHSLFRTSSGILNCLSSGGSEGSETYGVSTERISRPETLKTILFYVDALCIYILHHSYTVEDLQNHANRGWGIWILIADGMVSIISKHSLVHSHSIVDLSSIYISSYPYTLKRVNLYLD